MNRKQAIGLLVVNLLITLWLASTLPHTAFDYNFDKFFKRDDPYTTYFEAHRTTFGTDNDFVLVGITSPTGVFNAPFAERLSALTQALDSLPYVTGVLSPTTARIPVREPLTGALFERPLLTGQPETDSLNALQEPSMLGQLFSRDTTAVCIVISTAQKLTKDQCDTLAKELQHTLERFPLGEVHAAGRAMGQVVYIQKIQGEFLFFMLISVAFVVVLLYLLFKSFRGVVIPIATVLLAVVWSVGILNLAGSGISIMLTMLPPVIFVVGMSDAVHLYSRYLEELARGRTKDEAIRLTITDTGVATLLTSITTAIGFGSLWFTGIPTLQEFGLLTAAGVLVAFVIAITVLPAWLVLTPLPQKTLSHRGHNRWEDILRRIFMPVLRRRRQLFGAAIAITLLASLGASRIGLNNFILEDLRPGDPLREDFEYFERYFSGVRPFELGIVSRSGHSMLDADALYDLAMIEDWLTSEYGVGAVQSPVAVARTLHRSRNAGRPAYYTLPTDSLAQARNCAELKQLHRMGKLSTLVDSTAAKARMFGRVADLGAQAFAERNTRLYKWLAETGLAAKYDVHITGTGTLIDRTNQNLVSSLSKGLGVAFLLISLIMGFMFGSLSMVIVALIPNVLPLITVAAVMTLSGIDLKMSTSIIFTIAFGIAVDDTIHLLSRYKLELLKGRSRLMALRNSYVHTGKALVITSIILFGGFIGMCFSTFQSTYYIGLLVTLTLFFALLFDLTLLPALVAAFGGKKRTKAQG